MPYSVQRRGRGYKVVTKESGREHSKRPLSYEQAHRQLRALYANVPDARGNVSANGRQSDE